MRARARGLGAPESVPAGKVDDEHVVGAGARAGVADDGRLDVHDVAVAAHVHELDDVDGAGPADPLEVVAAEVDEHDVLGALLGVGEQLLGEAHVVLGGLAARAATRRWGG